MIPASDLVPEPPFDAPLPPFSTAATPGAPYDKATQTMTVDMPVAPAHQSTHVLQAT